MIASLSGTVAAVRDQTCIVDVNGVGYLVHITSEHKRTLSVGERNVFFTSLVVREDSMTLFGFESPESTEIFEVLLSVSGVGPRSALAILSEISPAEILAAVVDENDAAFKKVPGIGPKTAKLIIVQLAGKISSLAHSSHASASPHPSTEAETVVLNALVGLGWNEKIAQEALQTLSATSVDRTASSVLLKEALALLAGKK
ncbi:Holliday junction branch migration protein RuvA [Aurantimicrobium minutum]|uniref:Holliday junction branch migration complex subunit RuvA n=1 Tax=Aurantimicrobium minutum TaxID=708131 RepID=A0A173LW23_9MICO|nr:Holliday junction branch migration protein RuvA [Aurantimicrobium minutum]BAU99049.1 Holliday junction DNA helicase RuvA [Aurantimicrobium minutum]